MGSFEELLNAGAMDEKAAARDRKIVKTSVIGILANLFLAGFKAAVGLLSHSIAVLLDAVNNLSDAASSLITIVGTRLARKEPDRKHPFGYGRIEYLTAMVIALIVLYAGVTSLTESIRKIFSPETPEYSATSLAIISVAILVKVVLGRYVKHVGKAVHSDALVNSGEDARLDAVISLSTLVAAIIFLSTGFSLEAYLGAIISLVIVKSGLEMLKETLSRILGESADAELARAIKATVCAFEGVSGAYDLVLNNYGPDHFNGSIHIEVPETLQAGELDALIRRITVEVYNKHRVLLTAIGVYSINLKDDQAAKMRDAIKEKVLAHPHVRGMHGFYAHLAQKTARFDVVLSFDAKDRHALYDEIRREVQALYPDYSFQIASDFDWAEA